MDKITAASIAESKPDFVVTTQAAATLTLGAGEIGIFIGTNVKDVNNTRVLSALNLLRDHLREDNYPQGPLALTGAFSTPPDHGTSALNAATFPVFTEDQIVIAYEAGFYPAGNSSNFDAMLTSMIEVYQEQIAKFN